MHATTQAPSLPLEECLRLAATAPDPVRLRMQQLAGIIERGEKLLKFEVVSAEELFGQLPARPKGTPEWELARAAFYLLRMAM